jgi:hypothetical protein
MEYSSGAPKADMTARLRDFRITPAYGHWKKGRGKLRLFLSNMCRRSIRRGLASVLPKKQRCNKHDQGAGQGLPANFLTGKPAIDMQQMTQRSCDQCRDEKHGKKVPEPITSRVPHADLPPERVPLDDFHQIDETIKAF